MTDPIPYNPLDRDNLGRSVADALLDRPVFPLAKLNSFVGEGIYALYYVGDHPAYEEIAIRNRDDHFLLPIYVGKAVPKGARKGEVRTGRTKSRVLFNRLKEHRDSIKLVEAHPSSSLKLDDFYCRYLVVEDIWIPLGESLLIAKFSPLWNSMLDGFGNHDPGKGRYKGQRPRWDVLHPGRAWAEKCQDREETAEQIQTEMHAHLKLSNLPELPEG